MDLASLEPAHEGAEMQVRHPGTNAPIDGMVVTLLGMDSEPALRAQRVATNRRLKQGIAKMKLSAEELDSDGLDLLTALTVSWRGIEWDGKPYPCTPENARSLYTKLRWLREQVDEFVGERANFLPKSATS